MRFFYLIIYFVLISAVPATAQPEEGTLRWAADAEGNAPYIFQDPNDPDKLIGFEVDIARAIARKAGLRPVFVQNQWDGLIPGLKRGDYDIALNGIEITEDRREAVNFSIPYYSTYEQIVVRSGNEDISSLDDLRGKTAGALKNSLAERILREHGGIEVRTYEGEVNAFADLEYERLEAVLVDAPIALYYASWRTLFELRGGPIGEVKYAAAIEKADSALLRIINPAIAAIIESGELRRILEDWNLWNPRMEKMTGDSADLGYTHDKFYYFLSAQDREIDLSAIIERYISFLPSIGEAAWMTIKLSVLSMLAAIILGLIIAVARVYGPPPFRQLAALYVELIRGTPLLIQLLFIFYALPALGIKLDPFLAAITALGLNYAAYEAENYRAGLFSVPEGQMEAALSLGMSRRQALRYVILPQAVRLVIPPVTNDFIALLKDSSLVSVITLVELTKLYNQLASTYYDYIGTGILIALVYLLLGLPFVVLSRKFENRLTFRTRGKKENL